MIKQQDVVENIETQEGEISEKPKEVVKKLESNNKVLVSRDKLLEAGVYFGHKKDRWNPKMKPYIAMVKKGTHIIDIEKTKRTIEFAYSLISNYAKKGASFVFVGTRKQAKKTIKENALRTNSFYVSERWLGGTLTNSRTIFKRVRRMDELEALAENNYEGYTKKEGVLFAKELAKLHRNLTGIRNMKFRPTVMIIADPKADEIAVKEARKLGVKVVALVDTNNDPASVDIAIPANDDSIKSIHLIITLLADAIAEAKGGKALYAYKDDAEIILPEEPKRERPLKKRFHKGGKYYRNYRSTRGQNGNYTQKYNKNTDTNKTLENKSEQVKLEGDNKVVVGEEKQKGQKNSQQKLPEMSLPVKQEIQQEQLVKSIKDVETNDLDYHNMKVSDLKEILKAKGLPVSGTKTELIKRIEGA